MKIYLRCADCRQVRNVNVCIDNTWCRSVEVFNIKVTCGAVLLIYGFKSLWWKKSKLLIWFKHNIRFFKHLDSKSRIYKIFVLKVYTLQKQKIAPHKINNDRSKLFK